MEWSCLRSQYSQPGTLANSRVSSSSLTPRCVITNSRRPAAPPVGALPLPLPPGRCCSDEPAHIHLGIQSQNIDKGAVRCDACMRQAGVELSEHRQCLLHGELQIPDTIGQGSELMLFKVAFAYSACMLSLQGPLSPGQRLCRQATKT